jgi:hypothetical protein
MWDVLQKETAVQKGKTALRVDVANAVRRLWKVDADGRIPAWAPETTGPLGTCLSEDDELRQLMEGVAEAGSWAVWMGVFSKRWMKLLVAGGLTFKRARIVTGKISAIITECRCAVAKVRHERAAKEGAEAAKRRQEQLEKEVRDSMSVMGDRWAVVGNNRLTNSWRVVLRIYDAMYAGASRWRMIAPR